jgi:hypothetical protein
LAGSICARRAPSARRDERDVARIGLDVRVARRMDVALRAVELRRHLELAHEVGGREIAGLPGCTLALPDCCSSTGSQPISSSAPVQTTRSALRARAIRLGLAWIWCGSWSAVVATETSTSLPPSSCASAPHSGSHAKTRNAACAGATVSASSDARSATSDERSDAWFLRRRRLIGVRAVRAEAHLVLHEPLRVRASLRARGRARPAGARARTRSG